MWKEGDTVTLESCHMGKQLTAEQRPELWTLLREFSGVMNNVPGVTSMAEHRIETGNMNIFCTCKCVLTKRSAKYMYRIFLYRKPCSFPFYTTFVSNSCIPPTFSLENVFFTCFNKHHTFSIM